MPKMKKIPSSLKFVWFFCLLWVLLFLFPYIKILQAEIYTVKGIVTSVECEYSNFRRGGNRSTIYINNKAAYFNLKGKCEMHNLEKYINQKFIKKGPKALQPDKTITFGLKIGDEVVSDLNTESRNHKFAFSALTFFIPLMVFLASYINFKRGKWSV